MRMLRRDRIAMLAVLTATCLLESSFIASTSSEAWAAGQTVSRTIIASRDAFLRGHKGNFNEGASPILPLNDKNSRGRLLLGFDLTSVHDGFRKATLVLTIARNFDNWVRPETVGVHALLEDFTEGNGKSFDLPQAQQTRGSGSGVTWRCAVDTNIANLRRDCRRSWRGGTFRDAPSATRTHQTLMRGEVAFDVTQDFLEGRTAWLVKKSREPGAGRLYYHSREGAAAAGNPMLAPRLVLECAATTCEAAGADCGTIPDGCGGTLECGSCMPPATCGGGGTPNVCGGACQPTTCATEGKNCGSIPDGCGGMLTCGSCEEPESCGGGGTPNVCGGGCSLTTCAEQGKDCGTISDGCEGPLECGSCTEPATCGGSGIPNVCGTCAPTTCQTGQCGRLQDGCGGTIECGTCENDVGITSPAQGAYLNLSPVTVSGTVGDANATVTVNGVAAPVSGNTFVATGVR